VPRIPFTSFRGSLKQLTLAGLGEAQRALFALLFPRFFDEFERELEDNEALRELKAMPQVRFLQPRLSRRFGPLHLPRGRYYSVCSDAEGADGGTLMNELRAYRDPVRSGMVEVLDLGMGKAVVISGEEHIGFERLREVAAIIHEPERVETLLAQTPHEAIRRPDGGAAAIVRFPYTVLELSFEKAVDLREPATRDWFAAELSHPAEDWLWPETMPVLSTAEKPLKFLSKYRSVEGRAPVPRTFEAMLPSLISPALGGGDAGWAGMTLMGIGSRLLNLGADAFIYPSARSDVFVKVRNAGVTEFGGWCLVDYRELEDEEPRPRLTVLDSSPWSWEHLPEGVTARFQESGSFVLEGVAESSAREYVEQVAGLRAAEAAVGPRPARMTEREAWAIGALLLKYLHRALIGVPGTEIRESVRAFLGLAVRNDISQGGAILEIVHDLARDGDFDTALEESIRLFSRVSGAFEKETQTVYAAAFDLQLAFTILLRVAMLGEQTTGSPLDAVALREVPLPADLREEADAFLESIAEPGAEIHPALLRATELTKRLTAYFATRE
jgi:hypothetical protein